MQSRQILSRDMHTYDMHRRIVSLSEYPDIVMSDHKIESISFSSGSQEYTEKYTERYTEMRTKKLNTNKEIRG